MFIILKMFGLISPVCSTILLLLFQFVGARVYRMGLQLVFIYKSSLPFLLSQPASTFTYLA